MDQNASTEKKLLSDLLETQTTELSELTKGCGKEANYSFHYEDKSAWWTSYQWGWNAFHEPNCKEEICGSYKKGLKFFFLCKDCWAKQKEVLSKKFSEFNGKVLEIASNQVKKEKEAMKGEGIISSDPVTHMELCHKYDEQFN